MKSVIAATAAIVASVLSGASAQVISNPNGTFTCYGPNPNGAFCAGTSLQTNIIIRCVSNVGQPGNCNDNLAGIPPVGVKTFAPCYQSSPTAGDAVCSYNGIGYPSNGSAPFPLPGTSSSSSLSTTTSTVKVTTGTAKTTTVTTTVTVKTTTTTTSKASSSSAVSRGPVTSSVGGRNATITVTTPTTLRTPTSRTSAVSSPTISTFQGAGSVNSVGFGSGVVGLLVALGVVGEWIY